jgi:hypothetical protein
MILFCYFQIKPIERIAFSFTEKDALSEIDAAFNLVEADSKSEPFLVQEIAKMIAESEQVICFFDVLESEGLGALSKAIEALRKSKANRIFFVDGKNQQLQKVLQMLKQPVHNFESTAQLKAVLTESINS